MAIGPLANDEGAPPVVSLRTVKSDVVVGVDIDVAEKLDKEEPGWRISGKYAVVLLSEGQHEGKEAAAAAAAESKEKK
jgi:ABC-type amino acid transport substrate-binding protein